MAKRHQREGVRVIKRYSFGRGDPALRCERVKKNGERCKAVRCEGSKYCNRHGGGKYVSAGLEARRHWFALRPRLYSVGFNDQLAAMANMAGKVALGEAWLAAREHGDPVIYAKARREVAAKCAGRIRFYGREDLLEELGVLSVNQRFKGKANE